MLKTKRRKNFKRIHCVKCYWKMETVDCLMAIRQLLMTLKSYLLEWWSPKPAWCGFKNKLEEKKTLSRTILRILAAKGNR